MTIVITALLPNHIVQVSDRKLTWSIGGKVRHQEDRWNKATVFGDRAAIAYTGPARLPDQRTDQWIAETIASCTDVGEAVSMLRLGAQERLGRHEWNPRGLAIIVAAWTQSDNGLLPARFLVTDYEGSATGGPIRDEFVVFGSTQTDPGLSLYVAGQPLPRPQLLALGRTLKRSYKRRASMRSIAAIITRTARDLRNRYIGESFNAVVLPRPAAGRLVQALVGAMQTGPQPDAPCAYYFAAPGTEPTYVMPNVAGGGFVATDISVIPRVLSPAEIAERYRAGRPLPPRRR